MSSVVRSRAWKLTAFVLVIAFMVSVFDSPAEARKRRRKGRRQGFRAARAIRPGQGQGRGRRAFRNQLAFNNGFNRFNNFNNFNSAIGFDPFLGNNVDVQGIAALPAADAGGRARSASRLNDGKEKPVGDLRPVTVENRQLAGLFEDRQGNKFALDTAAGSESKSLKAVRTDESGRINMVDRAEVQSTTVRDSIDLFNNRGRLRSGS